MSEQNESIQAALAALLAQQAPAPTGVSVPVKVQTPMGSVRVYLQFPAEHATPERLPALLEALAGMGVPLDARQAKPRRGASAGGGGDAGILVHGSGERESRPTAENGGAGGAARDHNRDQRRRLIPTQEAPPYVT